MSNSSKKILKRGLSIFTSLATIVFLSGLALAPLQAGAQTLQEQIAALQAQIAALTAQLNALMQQAGQAPSTACNFTRNLYLGVVGEDVKCLQQYLNSTQYKVATSGAGSPGNETTYYGLKTKAAVASWQAGNGVSPASGYFGPLSRAKYQSLVAGGPGPGATPTPSVTPGQVVVSLSPDNPAAQTITPNSYGVPLMVVRFTGSGKVQELTFKRGGPGDVNDYDNLYIYEGARRLVNGRTPSSATGEVTFIGLNVEVNGTKDLTLVADHSATTGNVNYWELTNVKLDSGTVSGTPLKSNNFTVSGTNSGTITMNKVGSLGNPKVGQKNAQVSEFKLTANTEAAWIRRIQMLQGGTVKASDITNLRLEVNGVKVADGYMTSDDYAVFDFGKPGYKIEKGDNKTFKMYADLAGKKDETIKFYFETASDITGIGDQFGFGMQPTVTDMDTSSEAHSLTLQGGVLTIAFNGPNATNIGTKVSDQVLMRFSMSAANDIEVRKLRIGFCWDQNGNGTFDNISSDFDDVTDVKVVDEDTGQVVAGPVDGTGFTEGSTDGCPNSAQGTYKTYTDAFDLKAGTTRNLKVTADIDTGLNSTNVELAAGDIIKVMLDGYGESDLAGTSGDVSVLRYAGTNTAVDDSDIVPNTDILGNNFTLQAASLTLGLSNSPQSVNYVKGEKNADVVGFTFAASLASALKVTNITLTGYVSDDGNTYTKGVGSGADANLSVANLVSAVKLYDGDTGALIDDTPDSNNLNSSTGTIVFNNLDWNIPAGQTKKLLVKADLSANPVSGTADYFSFDIDATTDVTALDSSSQTVNAGNSDPNGATSPTVEIGVLASGTLAVALAPGTPITGAVYWGQNDVEFSRFRIRSQDEGFFIERLNIYSADTASNVTANIDQVKLEYKNKAGETLTAVGTLNSNASVSFGFSGDQRPYVPKDSSLDIVVKANIKPKAQRSGTALSTNGTEVNFSLDFSGGNADEFRAVGESSGVVIDGATNANIANVAGNNQYVYRVYPEFIQEPLAASEPVGTKDVLKFTIKAHGLPDSKILFDEPSSAQLRFEVVASGGADSDMTVSLYDVSTGELLASTTCVSCQSSPAGGRSSVNFNDWEKDVEIVGGSQKTFRVEVGFTNFLDKSDFFQLVLNDTDENTLVTYVDGAKVNEDNMVTNTAGVWRLLPMNGPIFTKQ